MDAELSSKSKFIIIKVSRDEDFRKQIGRDVYFDVVDHDKVCSFNVLKETPLKLFRDEVAKKFCIPVQSFRFWRWRMRPNGTCRPFQCLTSKEEKKSVEKLTLAAGIHFRGTLNLFLDMDPVMDSYTSLQPAKTVDDILVFFKLYDPVKEQLRYVGKLFVKSYEKLIDILGKLNQMACFAPDEEIELYEEIRVEPHLLWLPLDKTTSFEQSEIISGDIICFQKSHLECEENLPHPDVPSFLEYVLTRQDAPVNSLSATSLLENLTNVLTGISRTKKAKISTPSSKLSESGLSSNPLSLQQHREALKYYLALSLEDIEKANAFDQIERIAVLILQHSTSSLERPILKDLVSRLVAFKKILLGGKSSIEHMRAQLTSLTEKKAAVGSRLDEAVELGGSFEIKLSKLSEDEKEFEKQIVYLTTQKEELEKQIMHLTEQKEGLLVSKNSVALRVQKFNDQVSDDLAEWQDISKEVETANMKCLQEREKLAQANLSWKLFQQNLEPFVKKEIEEEHVVRNKQSFVTSYRRRSRKK